MYENEMERLLELYMSGLYGSPYYAKQVSGKDCFTSYEQFQSIPFSYKEDIRESSIMDRTATKSGDIFGIFSSSGTTGNKTYYIYNKKDKIVHESFVKTYLTEIGIIPSDIGGIMAPIDTGVMAHTMMWEFTTMGASYVNCPEPSPHNMISVLDAVPVTVIATRPNVVSSPIYTPELIGRFRKSSVNKLILGGGFLSSERRKLIEYLWDAKCFNLFGMSEMFGPMAAECQMRDGLHYLDNYLMIELIDPTTGKPVPSGEPGVAVYTTLWDKGFPLLRYWTDDYMLLDHENCKCGSQHPRLRYLGRLGDCHKTDDGRFVFPEQVENILFSNNLCGEYYIDIQPECIIVSAENVPAPYSSLTADSYLVEDGLQELFGANDIKLNLVPAGTFAPNAHGKRFANPKA
ncbi:MAG: phenylacetate--CoA ligase family protein [Eggerthellaceae bacterium]|nr:phenylacetate--CoA ligase family protein [Eggerthellaceae bacterium]